MMLASVVLARKVFLVAGAIGSIWYVTHLIWSLTGNPMALLGMLIAAGIGIIYLGVFYRNHKDAIENAIVSAVPQSIRDCLPGR